MLDKEMREPLFDYLEEFYGKIRIFEEKNAGGSRSCTRFRSGMIYLSINRKANSLYGIMKSF